MNNQSNNKVYQPQVDKLRKKKKLKKKGVIGGSTTMTKKEKQNTLTTKTINITELKPAPYNPRIMPPSEQLKLKNGLETFGLVDPIIIDLTDENTVIGGHQRLEVLREINDEQDLTLIPLGDIGLVIREKELKIKDKNDQKALNLSLNKIQGDWDYKKLDDLLLELNDVNYNLDLTGFDDNELMMISLESDIDYDYLNEEETLEDIEKDYSSSDKNSENNENKLYSEGIHKMIYIPSLDESNIEKLIDELRIIGDEKGISCLLYELNSDYSQEVVNKLEKYIKLNSVQWC